MLQTQKLSEVFSHIFCCMTFHFHSCHLHRKIWDTLYIITSLPPYPPLPFPSLRPHWRIEMLSEASGVLQLMFGQEHIN